MIPDEKELIEAFLAFAETKGIELGGDVILGWAMERTEYRPMDKRDYHTLIADFISTRKTSTP